MTLRVRHRIYIYESICVYVEGIGLRELPQAAVAEEPEAREAESGGGAEALRFPISGSYHNQWGRIVIIWDSEGQIIFKGRDRKSVV